ncbi:MAG: sigma-70 family RNA polymerase sigma factor [Steroidobacteraceae bacterium]
MDDTLESGVPGWVFGPQGRQFGAGGRLLSVEDLISRCHPGDRQDASPGDEELALRFRRGDDQAFHLLYARFRAPLLRFIRRITPDPSDVEEVVQEVWLAVIRGRERYVQRARFATYLFSIARRRSIDRWRRRGVQLGAAEDVDELDALPAPMQTGPEFRAQREAIGAAILCAVDALPSRETAKSRLRYALRRLRTALEPSIAQFLTWQAAERRAFVLCAAASGCARSC